MTQLIPPYGGNALATPMTQGAHRDALLQEAASLPSVTLRGRRLCDLELLLNGALSPLQSFMGRADHERVVNEMRLADGTFWPMPIVLDAAEPYAPGTRLALRQEDGAPLAILTVSEAWRPDKEWEAHQVFDENAVIQAQEDGGDYYLGGTLEGLNLPSHRDFAALRLTPAAAREKLSAGGHGRVVAFPAHHVMHRAQVEFTRHTAVENDAALLIQAISEQTADEQYFTRIRCCRAALPHYPDDTATLSLLPLAGRPAGLRGVLWQAIVARNFGCSHFIIGGDAGTGDIRRGADALAPRQIQPLAEHFAAIGVEPITFPRMVYVPDLGQYLPEEYLPPEQATLSLSAAELQQRILDGREDIPDWASFPEILTELRRLHPPRSRRGFTVFFTGLSASGKTTVSQALRLRLLELTGRPITVLDGDVVRTLLSSGLSFSKADRDLNIRRIGFVAAEITRHGGIAICAPIAPYRETRQAVRDMVAPCGGFFEVHVSTSLEVCEARDPKGLYVKARAGLIKEFTGVSDPYEPPHAPEVRIDTAAAPLDDAVDDIVRSLRAAGYIAD